MCLPDHVAFDIGQQRWLDDGLFKVCIKLLCTSRRMLHVCTRHKLELILTRDTLLEMGLYSLHEA